jgi:NAD+ synthase (glutamine-hydrolysing)
MTSAWYSPHTPRYRGSVSSLSEQAAAEEPIERLEVNQWLGVAEDDVSASPTPSFPPRYHTPEEECAFGPACWLWDYLRRSGASGFFLALSGGADSSAVACIIGTMCNLVSEAVRAGDAEVTATARRIAQAAPDGSDGFDLGDPVSLGFMPTPLDRLRLNPINLGLTLFHQRVLANCLLHSCFMGSVNSSQDTRRRAATLADEIGRSTSPAPSPAPTSSTRSSIA